MVPSVFDTCHNLGLERVSFFEQLLDTMPPLALEASARAPAIPSRRFPPTFASTPMPSLKA